MDKKLPGLVREVFEIVCGTCVEASADSRSGTGNRVVPTGRSQHKPVLDMEVGSGACEARCLM